MGISNDTRFGNCGLAGRVRFVALVAKVSPRSGPLTLGRRLCGPLHDATQTPPVSALKRAASCHPLEAEGYIAHGGQIIDATIVSEPKQRNTKE